MTNGTTQKKVVVNLEIVTIHYTDDDIFISTISELPLTSYGSNSKEAVENVKRLFGRFVRTHRQRGTLADILDRAGVVWYWEEAYPKDQMAYEDLGFWSEPASEIASSVRDKRLTIMDAIGARSLDDWSRVGSGQSDTAGVMVAA